MPFSLVKSQSSARFNEVLQNLAAIEALDETTLISKINRGLYYVHLYSALEKTINEAVEQALILIQSRSVKNKHFKMHFNVISLQHKLQGFKSCGYKEYFNKSSDIFQNITSDDIFPLNNTIFSQSLQNVWFKTIQETLTFFGANDLNLESRIKYTIDEIVERRNAVAHGRESAAQVGEKHRATVLRTKTNDIQLVADLFVATFESYINNSSYIKDEYISLYR